VSNALLVPSKRRKRKVCRDPNPSDTPSDSDTDLAVPFADDSTEKEQDDDCVFCTGRFSEERNGEEWILCAKYFRLAHTLCTGMEEDSVCEISQGIKSVLFLVCILCICNFLYSVTILSAFCVNYSPP